MQGNQNIKLSYIEVVKDRTELLLSHVWWENESLHVESVEEEFDSISLYYIVGINNYLSLNHTQFFESKQDHEFVKSIPSDDIVVIYLLEFRHLPLLIIQLDYKGFTLFIFRSHIRLFNLIEVFLKRFIDAHGLVILDIGCEDHFE